MNQVKSCIISKKVTLTAMIVASSGKDQIMDPLHKIFLQHNLGSAVDIAISKGEIARNVVP